MGLFVPVLCCVCEGSNKNTAKPQLFNIGSSFTMAKSDSFSSPYEILGIAQENKYLGKLFYLS